MIQMEEILYTRVKGIMDTWDEEGIYAVSFFVYSNEAYCYGEYDNVTEFHISYNTESDCHGAGRNSERRWNYAYWRQNDSPIISSWRLTAETHQLFDWYKEQGITNIGQEPEDADCPVGYEELLGLVAKVARRLQEEGFLREKFGRAIPIIIHDLEYIPLVIEATQYANPNGEAEDFLAMKWMYGDDEEDVEIDDDDPQVVAMGEQIGDMMRQILSALQGAENADGLVKELSTEEGLKAFFAGLFGNGENKSKE